MTQLATIINGQLRKSPGSYNQFAQGLAIVRSRHTGVWQVTQLNTAYGYWSPIRGGATSHEIPQDVVDFLLNLPAYTGPLAEVDADFRLQATCG